MNDRGYLEFGMKMLDETRRLILLSIKEGFDREQKADESFVTSVDRKLVGNS